MSKERLDIALVSRKLVATRSQAENYIRLGKVTVAGKVVTKSGFFVADDTTIALNQAEQYVSRAGLKLASVATTLNLDFTDKIVLDVGSSTGGFTDYALQHGAKKVFAIDVGTNQLHPSLHGHPNIELHEQTNILDVRCSMLDARYASGTDYPISNIQYLTSNIDLIVIDVSFISLRDILPHIAQHLAGKHTLVIAMCKPQFEAGADAKHKGVIKNDAMRRKILHDFEQWAKQYYVIVQKADSDVKGAKGNQERFYKLTKI